MPRLASRFGSYAPTGMSPVMPFQCSPYFRPIPAGAALININAPWSLSTTLSQVKREQQKDRQQRFMKPSDSFGNWLLQPIVHPSNSPHQWESISCHWRACRGSAPKDNIAQARLESWFSMRGIVLKATGNEFANSRRAQFSATVTY